jgi:hypothetical protein
MSMQTWAEKEIEIACKREKEASETEEGCFDYGCACYESAYKAFKSLTEDGHSGFSIGLTKNILNRLIDGKPLTPIEDTPDVWSDVMDRCDENKYTCYQCNRMSALFKYVYDDGTIKYKDIDSNYSVNVDSDVSYHSGLVQRIMDELYPVTMPYYPPNKPTKFVCEEFLTDRKNGDFDTVGVLYCVRPDGEKVEINRFFQEAEHGWDEIDEAEYNKRKDKKLGN